MVAAALLLGGEGSIKALAAASAMVALNVFLFLLGVVCASAFSVHATPTSVKQVLLDRFALSDYPVADFVNVIEERHALLFTRRRRLHLAGLHESELRIEEYLRAQQTLAPPNKSLEYTCER